jgi:vacuolar-type H+-ATPase catalytic subunit A/Vma1
MLPLNVKKEWEFQPNSYLREGNAVVGGDIIGWVYEN